MYAKANGAPVTDAVQDVTLVSASETGGVTTVTFKRKINTCDTDDDNVIMVGRTSSKLTMNLQITNTGSDEHSFSQD